MEDAILERAVQRFCWTSSAISRSVHKVVLAEAGNLNLKRRLPFGDQLHALNPLRSDSLTNLTVVPVRYYFVRISKEKEKLLQRTEVTRNIYFRSASAFPRSLAIL